MRHKALQETEVYGLPANNCCPSQPRTKSAQTSTHLLGAKQCVQIPRIVWDLFGMFFLMRDIVFIPLQLFDVPEYQTMKLVLA